MCEIFAFNAKRPARANDWLREFFADSPRHPHGWGLSWHRPDGSLWLDKEPLPAHNSEYLDYLLRAPIRTNWLVAHIREASRGRVTYENCHPFRAADATGTTWVFAHNGTMLEEVDSLLAYRETQRGATDSERVLLYLLDRLGESAARHNATLGFSMTFSLLAQHVETLSDGNKLNFVLGDGIHTYVHTNTIQPTLWRHHGTSAAHVCTRPLDSVPGAWEPVPPCRLIAYRAGEVIAESATHGARFDNDEYLRTLEIERREGKMEYLQLPIPK